MVLAHSVRFIHAADLHLDSPFKGLRELPPPLFKRVKESAFTSFKRVVDAAVKEHVDFVVIAGDLYDGANRSLRAQTWLRKQLDRLGDAGIHVYAIHGNHDHLDGNWHELEWPPHVHFFRSGEVETVVHVKDGYPLVHLYGFSYPERAVMENMTSHYQKQAGAPFHIGLLHGNAEGNTGHDPYAPFTVTQLLEKEFDYWALGHIHKRQILHEQPPIVYAGNPQGRHRNETGEKGCTLVELREGHPASLTFIPTADILWEQLELSITGKSTVNELINEYDALIRQMRHGHTGTLVDLVITGIGPLHHVFAQEEQLADFIETLREAEEHDEDFIWINRYENQTRLELDRDQLKQQSTFLGTMLGFADSLEADLADVVAPLYDSRKARRFLEALSEGERAEMIRQAEALLLNELVKEE